MDNEGKRLTGNGTNAPVKGENQANGNGSGRLIFARMADGRVAVLTRREVDVLELIAAGKNNKEIARTLVITIHTVKAHVTRILYKMGAESRTEAAVLWATREGLRP